MPFNITLAHMHLKLAVIELEWKLFPDSPRLFKIEDLLFHFVIIYLSKKA